MPGHALRYAFPPPTDYGYENTRSTLPSQLEMVGKLHNIWEYMQQKFMLFGYRPYIQHYAKCRQPNLDCGSSTVCHCADRYHYRSYHHALQNPVMRLASFCDFHYHRRKQCIALSTTAQESIWLPVRQIITQAKTLLREALKQPQSTEFTTPQAVMAYIQLMLANKERGVFACLFLDNRHRLIKYEEMFYGTIDGATVHPREVVKQSLRLNAAAVIISHIHPSGLAEPSHLDVVLTERLKVLLALVDGRLLDHFIIGVDEPVSLAEIELL